MLPILQHGKPEDCRYCSLEVLGESFLEVEGTGVNKVLLAGEAAGAHEARDRLPFRPYAQAGHVLEMAIRSIGATRNQFVITNVVNCRPPGNELNGASYEAQAIEHCKVHFRRIVERFKPTVIVALGGIAARTLTGLTGKKLNVEMIQGFPIMAIDYPGIWVIPTYHPSYIERGAWEVFPVVRRALEKAVRIGRNGYQQEEVAYVTKGGTYELEKIAEELEGHPELPVSIDWETKGEELLIGPEEEDEQETIKKDKITVFQDITQANFSIASKTAVAVVFEDEFKPGIQRICATDNIKCGHNFYHFDAGVAKFNGIHINGPVHDTMWMFHWLYPDLPGRRGKMSGSKDTEGSVANLQFCASMYDYPWPWKHEFDSNPGWYGCCDGDAGLRVYLRTMQEMKMLGIWDGYMEGVFYIWPILERMQRRGIPVNKEKLSEFVSKLDAMAEIVFQRTEPLIPEVIRSQKQKKGRKKTPKDTTGMVQRTFFIPEEQPEKCECRRRKNKQIVTDPNCPKCGGSGFFHGEIIRWCNLTDVKLGSPILLKNYAKHFHHTIPKNRDGGYSMDKDTLIAMAKRTKDPVYSSTIEYRELKKMETTYGLGWMPEEDGCVHTNFGFAPATGQFNAKGPNTQNVADIDKFGARTAVKEFNIAEQFRECVEAWPGHSFLKADWKSFHVQTLAQAAKDWQYLRLGKIDAHSYLAAWILKLPDRDKALEWDDQKLRAWLKVIKENYIAVRNGQAKPAILGWSYGMGAATLVAKNPWDPDKKQGFKNLREGQETLDALDHAFPIAARFRKTIPMVAKRQKHLISSYGAIRWFWNIETWDFRTRKWKHGKDWEKAISYYPQANAFGHKKRVMRRMADKEIDEKYGLCNDEHDALNFHVRDELIDEALYVVKAEMEQPSEILLMPDGSGLSVEVEVKVGKNWKDMTERKVKLAA